MLDGRARHTAPVSAQRDRHYDSFGGRQGM
jgi:hypothetical protein